MIRHLLEARRRAKAHRDLEGRLASLKLGLTIYETAEEVRRRHVADAILLLLMVLGCAGILFGSLDPICETLDYMLRALA